MLILNPDWLPNCRMRRIITHWTAGTYEVSALDRKHYHFLIDGDGAVHCGDHSVADNLDTSDGHYAAHTRGCNQGSIGVSVCCMAGAVQCPFSPGRFPLKPVQWENLALTVADLCGFYRVPVTPASVLGHGEVQKNLGIRQTGKWDPMVLPWDRMKPPHEVGDAFRALVRSHLAPVAPEPEVRPKVKIMIEGKEYDGVLDDGTSFVKLRPVADFYHWSITDAIGPVGKVTIEGKVHELDFVIEKSKGYAETRDVAALLGKPIFWNPSTRTVQVG